MMVIFVIVIVNMTVIFVMLTRNVMNHMSHHFNLFEATHFVLSGTSAGGFGVRSDNCDDEPEFYFVNICIAITITVFPIPIPIPITITRKLSQVGLNCDDVADWLHANNPNM